MFSRSCQYALQAALFLALRYGDDKAIGLREIAESQNLPAHYLGKILQSLVRRDILGSAKGPNGGFFLQIPPEKISLMEIVKLIDGTHIFDRCGIGLKTCSDSKPCPIHKEYKVVKQQIRELLQSNTLEDLCEDVREGKSIVSILD